MSEQIPSMACAIRQEAARFESLHQTLDNLYNILQEVDNIPVKIRMRELVNNIEGMSKFSHTFICISCYLFLLHIFAAHYFENVYNPVYVKVHSKYKLLQLFFSNSPSVKHVRNESNIGIIKVIEMPYSSFRILKILLL